MTAPFALPDTCDIYDDNDTTLLYEAVPCRQVPNTRSGRQSVLTDSQVMWTHWIDFNPDQRILDDVAYQPGGPSVNPVPNWVYRFTFGGVLLKLVGVYVEDRYTNTENHYKRVYCSRFSRTDTT